jgi:hypothetical protein
MNAPLVLTLALFACAPCWAQSTKSAPPQATAPTSTPGGEPNVKRTVIEDDGARIEELKVRGQTQRIVVTPKVGPKASSEIITGDGSRDLSPGANTSRGAAGKRVWNVLNF